VAIITGDFETYYDQQYSLRRMSTAAYILDHRFQTIMLSLKVDDGPSEVLIGHDRVARRLSQIDWNRAAWLSHHTNFDGAILAWRYGVMPKMYLDTLSMARATTHWVLGRSSLEKVSDYLGLPPKGHEVTKAIGKRLEHFTPAELDDYAAYCMRDNDNCFGIFQRLRPLFPASELRLIDLICRMFILPQVQLDPNVLAEHLHAVKVEKQATLDRVAHIDKSVFSSNQKFAALLEGYGVEVPRKISPTTGRRDLRPRQAGPRVQGAHEDESQPIEVQAVLAARLGVKSTIEETRTEKLLEHSLRDWGTKGKAWAAVGSS
jgi:hypothetical protein